MTKPFTSFERATSAYDPAHEKELTEAITRAIFTASHIDDPPVLVLRTGEIAAALQTVLAGVLAMSPSATRSPKAIRDITDRLRRRLIKNAAKGAADPEMQDFMDRVFRDDDDKRGGRA